MSNRTLALAALDRHFDNITGITFLTTDEEDALFDLIADCHNALIVRGRFPRSFTSALADWSQATRTFRASQR